MPKRTATPGTTFAYAFGITPTAADDWFDPKLGADTRLFVDPFLMFSATSGPWATVQTRMVDFFNEALGLIAAANGNHTSRDWQRAAAMLSFPEPAAFCLGYGERTIFGHGSGGGLGRGMLASGERAVRAGIRNINDFGELMLFNENFGPDRISDMTCNIVMDLFVDYTQDVVARHSIATESFVLPHKGYDFTHGRWNRTKEQLPRNPCWQDKVPVLLVPDDFVIDLPVMDDGAFWDWVYNNFSQQLRAELNLTLDANIDRAGIIARAKQSPGIARRYGIRYAQKYRADPPTPYDLAADPAALTKPLAGAQLFASEVDATAPTDADGIDEFVDTLIAQFKWIAEQRRLWKNFWAGDQPIHEPTIGTLFDTAVVLACQLMDVDVTRESDAGRGPVDFKFSAGWEQRTIVEIKFAKSTSYWDNLEQQPKTYAVAEGITTGTFLVIQHYDRHCTPEFEAKTREILEAVSAENGITLKAVFVDVRPKTRASDLKRDKGSTNPGATQDKTGEEQE